MVRMKVTVVAGNPKPASRTLDAATRLAAAVSGQQPDSVIDVITLGAGLLGWGDPDVAAAVKTVAVSDLIVVASPTFKATASGELKLFLDQFATGDGLQDVVAVPRMLGAGPGEFEFLRNSKSVCTSSSKSPRKSESFFSRSM